MRSATLRVVFTTFLILTTLGASIPRSFAQGEAIDATPVATEPAEETPTVTPEAEAEITQTPIATTPTPIATSAPTATSVPTPTAQVGDPSSFSVEGYIKDTSANPLQGAEVCVTINMDVSPYMITECALTDQSGHFVVSSLPDGDGYVRASKYGYHEYQMPVSLAGSDWQVSMYLGPKTSFEVSGQVVDEYNIPLAGVEVCLNNYDSEACIFTDQNGSYSIESIVVESFYIYTSHDEYWNRSADFDYQSADITQDFTLRKVMLTNVTGQVVDMHGNPVEGAWVSLLRGKGGYGNTLTQADGRFTMVDIRANGPFVDSFVIDVPGCADGFLEQINLTYPTMDMGTIQLDCVTPIAQSTVSPVSGRAGTAVTVTGTNYRPGEVVTIRWGSATGTPLGTVTVTSSGTFSKSVVVPATAKAQAYYIHATAPSGKKSFAKYTVTALAVVKVTLSRVSGQAGTAVTVSGSGFQPGEVVTIRWGSATGTPLGTATATSSGTFSKSVIVPATAKVQAYYIHATAPSGQKSYAKYTVSALAVVKVILNKTSGQAGTAVTVSGFGFQPGEVVTIRWGSATGTPLGTITATSGGTFSKSVIVPATAKKQAYYIHATAPSGQKYFAKYTVTALAVVKVVLNKTSGQAGTAVTVSGSGFQPGEVVTIRWGSATGPSLGTIKATVDGKFSKSVIVPATAKKQAYYIHATAPSGQKSYAKYTVTMLAMQPIWHNEVAIHANRHFVW